MPAELKLELGKPGIREDPADSGMVLADFPLSETADPRWMSIFAVREPNQPPKPGPSPENPSACEATPSPKRYAPTSPSSAGVATTNAAYNGSGDDEPLTALQQVIDDEFDRR